MALRNRALALLWLGISPAPLAHTALAAAPALPPTAQRNPSTTTGQLERSWQRLDKELRALDQLLPSEPEPPVGNVLATPQLPANLIRANQPASGPIQPADAVASPPLDLSLIHI